MPSLWDLLCVSRQQKYSTHAHTSQKAPHRRWEAPRQYSQSDVEYYIRPDLQHLPLGGPEPYSTRDSPSWCAGSAQSSPRRGEPRVSPGRGAEDDDVSLLSSLLAGSSLSGDGKADASRRQQLPHHTPLHMLATPLPSQALHHTLRDDVERKKEDDDVSNKGKRRHVQDIFLDNARYHDNNTPDSSSSVYDDDRRKKRNSREVLHNSRQENNFAAQVRYRHPRPQQGSSSSMLQDKADHTTRQNDGRYASGPDNPRTNAEQHGEYSGYRDNNNRQPDNRQQRDSMYQYSPRSVNDDSVSAALFGNRLDDFVPDPAWNRAMDRFAASPTSSSSPPSSFSEPNLHPTPGRFLWPTPGLGRGAAEPAFPRRQAGSPSSPSPRTVVPPGSDGNVMFALPFASGGEGEGQGPGYSGAARNSYKSRSDVVLTSRSDVVQTSRSDVVLTARSDVVPMARSDVVLTCASDAVPMSRSSSGEAEDTKAAVVGTRSDGAAGGDVDGVVGHSRLDSNHNALLVGSPGAWDQESSPEYQHLHQGGQGFDIENLFGATGDVLY